MSLLKGQMKEEFWNPILECLSRKLGGWFRVIIEMDLATMNPRLRQIILRRIMDIYD